MEYLVEAINQITGVDIRKKTRKRENVMYRSLFFTLCRKHDTFISYQQIANFVGLDHATAIHGVKNFDIYNKYYPEISEVEKKLLPILGQNKNFDEKEFLRERINLLEKENFDLKAKIGTANSIGTRIDILINNSKNKDILIERLEAFIKMNC